MSSIDDINSMNIDPALRDILRDLHQQGLKRYVSVWVRIDKNSAFHDFRHGLFNIPHVVDVLQSLDGQGSGQVVATDVTVTKTTVSVIVTNTSTTTPKFFQVRAF